METTYPATPSIKHLSVVVESHDSTTTSPLTNSLGGSPARTSGERTPENPHTRAGVMSHYPPHHQPQPQQHPPQPGAGRDPRYVQMITTGPPPHYQGAPHHVAYLPPNIPQLYGASAPPAGSTAYAAAAPGAYPPHAPPPPQGAQQHAPQSAGQHHQTYVIAGYPPPPHGHQQAPPPAPGQQFYAVPASSFPPGQGGAYHPHHPHAPPPHAPPPTHHHHAPPPSHHHHPGGHQAAAPHQGGPVYVRHGPPPAGGGAPPYPPPTAVMYSQQAPPQRHHMAAISASTHSSAVSKGSTHPSDKDVNSALPLPTDPAKGPAEALPSMEELQAEREKEEMAMEQILKSVKPIQTDYHLYIEEQKEKFMEEATKEAGDDAYLRNSNLNFRLKAAWESLESSQRAVYLKREELDRKRFMEEEEIASRHCATLTARHTTPIARTKKPQSTAEVTVDEEEEEDDDEARDEPSKRGREKESTDPNDSPLKKERVNEQAENVVGL